MSVWVIIPVKPLRLAKSRLASILTPEQRQRFAEAMLRQVLQVVDSVSQITGVLVISRDNRALALAREYGAKTVQESGTPVLNAALMRATQIIANWGGESVLVLPADLPLINAEDIRQIIGLGSSYPSIVLSTESSPRVSWILPRRRLVVPFCARKERVTTNLSCSTTSRCEDRSGKEPTSGIFGSICATP